MIQQEMEMSKQQYSITTVRTDTKKEIAELTRRNVALIESMIRYNSDYSNSSNAKNDKSSAYWLKELKKEVVDNQKSKFPYRKIIENCVQYIDSENSTRLNADGVGRKQMSERLAKLDKAKLVEYLRHPEKENYKLIEILTEKTEPEDSRHNGRKNFSFATKFCHYACFYLFEGLREQDNFSIYDSIVAKHLLDYAKYFNTEIKKGYKSNNYKAYITIIDDILAKAEEKISRNGFDHLLWYFHKAR